jgi:hypothetical protein
VPCPSHSLPLFKVGPDFQHRAAQAFRSTLAVQGAAYKADEAYPLDVLGAELGYRGLPRGSVSPGILPDGPAIPPKTCGTQLGALEEAFGN